MMSRENVRLAVVGCLLVAAALFIHGRSRIEKVPVTPPVASFENSIGDWRGTDLVLDDKTLATLGQGDFLARRYTESSGAQVELFLAYFPSQTTGQTIHSPKNCLPGAGWLPVESTRTTITAPGRAGITVNRYILGKGAARQVVFYWYQAHARAVASEYWAKIYLVMDAARLNRTDGALVRVSTPMMGNETLEDAEKRARWFTEQVIPKLDSVIPI